MSKGLKGFQKGNKLGKINKGKKHTKATKKLWSKIRKGKNLGETHPNWKGYRRKYRNRWFLFLPQHPFSIKTGIIRQSRIVVEKHIDRYLTQKEEVHHINNNSLDDRPENLYLFSCKKEHMRHHGWKITPKLKSNLVLQNF